MTTHYIYHGGCPDGHTSAWLFWLGGGHDSADVEFHAQHDRLNPPKSIAPGDEVFIADYSFPRDVLLELSEQCHVTLLDHHKTAQADLEGLDSPNLNIIFDMDKSGAMLVLDYLEESGSALGEAATLVEYVQDYDLWEKVLPFTEEVNAVVQSTPQTFEDWQLLAERLDDPDGFGQVVGEGQAIRRYQRKIIDAAKKDARWIMIGGHRVLITQSPYALGSMIAGELAEENPDMPFGAYYITRGGEVQFGLRSRSDDDGPGFDVSEVAKGYGGGGHHNASGFITSWVIDPLDGLS
jgi:hypothetical protein